MVFLRLVAVSDIAHANDATLSPQLYRSPSLPPPPTTDGARGLAYGTRCSVHLRSRTERSRVGKSVRRGDEREEEEEGEKNPVGRGRLNGIEMTLP